MATQKEGTFGNDTSPPDYDSVVNNKGYDWKGLLKEWDLSEFENAFKLNGWTDIVDWKEIREQDMTEMGLKRGHIIRFERNLNGLKINNVESKEDNDEINNYHKYIKPGIFYKIKNNNVYLDNWGTPKQGQDIKLASRDNKATDKNYSNQLWRFIPTIYGQYYKIQSFNFYVFMDNWGNPKQGQVLKLGQYDNPPNAKNYTNQLWQIIATNKNGYYKLSNCGLYLDNWSNAKQGQQVKLASRDNKPTDNNYSNQLWQFIECPFPKNHF